MNHFLIHIGSSIPIHLKTCIDNILKINTKNCIFLCTDQETSLSSKRLTILSPSDLSIPHLNNFLQNDPNPLWYTSLHRIFYLNSFLKAIKTPVIHFDNDVLYYYPITDIYKYFEKPGVYITPHTPTQFTFGFSLINDFQKFDVLCNRIYNGIQHGEHFVRNLTKDHIHEMRLIGFYGHDLITKLPVYPNTETYGNFIFDPSSYGQYLDGTPNGHLPGFIDKEQIVGSSLQSTDIITFNKIPKLIHKLTEYNIFNLHIHTKQLHRYAI